MHSSLRVQALRHIVLVGSGVITLGYVAVGGAGCADALGGGDAERGDGVRQFVERRAEGHGNDAVRQSPADGLALHPARAEGPGRARHERGAKATRPGAGRYDRADWVEEGPGDHGPRRSASRSRAGEEIKLEGHKGGIYEVERGSGYYNFVVYGVPADEEKPRPGVPRAIMSQSISPWWMVKSRARRSSWGQTPPRSRTAPSAVCASWRPRKTRRASSCSRSTTRSARLRSSVRPPTATSSLSVSGRRIR